MELIIIVVAFLGVAALVGGLAVVMWDRGPKSEERLTAFTTRRAQTKSSAEVGEIWKKQAFEGDKKSLLEQIVPKIPTLDKLFEQAESNIKPSSLIVISLLLGLGGAVFSWGLLKMPWYLLPLPTLFMFSLPWIWLFQKRRKRLKTFASQLPDALELVARALRAGHSLAAGMHVVAEEMPAPVATEFGRIYEEQNLGIPLEESMRAMCERVPNLDLRFFVTSVAIQRQTGGDLAEILDKIGYVIRERYKILGMVRALTAEGRLSGIILIALPFLLFLVVIYINYEYISYLWTHRAGIWMGVIALIMQLVGALVIRWIVNIKV